MAVVAVGGYLVYFNNLKFLVPSAQQNNSPISLPSSMPVEKASENWKTYKDPQGLFTIQYPPGSKIKVLEEYFQPKSNPKPEGVLTGVEIQKIYQSGDTIDDDNVDPFSLLILVWNNNDNLTIEKQKEIILKGLCPDTLAPYKNGDINGLYFVACSKSTLMGMYRQQTIVHITKDKIYEFTFNNLAGEDAGVEGKTREYLDQILSTFKFIND